MSEIKHLKEKVIDVLKTDEQSRNSDIRLTQCIWYRYYRRFLFQDANGRWCVKIDNLFDLPREDNIKRIRAKIQNDQNNPKYLPTSIEICKARKIKEEVWRKHLGYNPEMRTI